ncbi:MAG: sugar transferase [Candidatus Buchananbacteria bacterium]|nr:sugar transferase [Candidatus Buchananbacteria bacterium]
MGKDTAIKTRKYILMIGDIAILYFSLWLTLVIRYFGNYEPWLWSRHILPFTVVYGIWLLAFYIDDIYELSFRQGRAGLIVRIVRDIIIGGFFAVVFFYLGQDRLFTIRPQTTLAVNSITALVLIYAWHTLFDFITKSSKISNNLLIIGLNSLAQDIINQIEKTPQLGLRVKTIITIDDQAVPESLQKIAIKKDLEELHQICLEHKISTIVSTVHPRENPALMKGLFSCLPLKISFFDIATFYEKIMGRVPINTIEQIWFLENLAENNKRVYEIIKRLFDVVASLIILVISLPIIPFIALAIKLSSKGPVFFSQIRTGKNGKDFKATKFRTMIIEAEKNGPQWAAKNDPRITRVGKFMRKTRLDEIPQLFNVLRGEMSLIGPRPERPEFVNQLQNQIPFYKERLLVKPGLTGWAQVMGPAYGGSVEESYQKLQYDLYYIKNRSLAVDLSISLKTIKTILTRQGQ